MTAESVRKQLLEHRSVMDEVGASMTDAIVALGAKTLETVRADGTLFFCGNGGSAADAQHLAAEYVVRFQRERTGVAALALTTDTSVLTAGGNDYGFETIFERQLHALARSGDLLTMHSTSGKSENLLRAATAARAKGVFTVALLAKGGGALASLVDLALVVPTESTARAQEVHLTIGHIVCDFVDEALSESP